MIAETWEALQSGSLADLNEQYPILRGIVDKQRGRIKPTFNKQFASILIDHIMRTAIPRVKDRMATYLREHPDPADHHPLKERLASEKTILDDDPVFLFLRKMQKRYIIHSYEISRENQKGKYVLQKLLKAYLGYPLQLPDNVLIWYSELCSISAVREAIPSSPDDRPNIRYINEETFADLRVQISKDVLFFRAVCDYISTMTDRYAVTEYQRLFGTSFGETS